MPRPLQVYWVGIGLRLTNAVLASVIGFRRAPRLRPRPPGPPGPPPPKGPPPPPARGPAPGGGPLAPLEVGEPWHAQRALTTSRVLAAANSRPVPILQRLDGWPGRLSDGNGLTMTGSGVPVIVFFRGIPFGMLLLLYQAASRSGDVKAGVRI
jgi:hypothetical protein